jgi:putative DNA primase/helicase
MGLKLSDSGTTLSAQSVTDIPAIFRQYITKELADPGELVADGEWRQFQTPGDLVSEKQGRKAGTVMLSSDSLSGAFGSRRPGECAIRQVTFGLPASQRPTPEQTAANESAARQKRQDNEQDAADRAGKVWTACSPVPADNAYFQARGVAEVAGVAADVCRIHPNGTVIVAMKDGAGRLANIERIKPDGTKAALAGGRTAGLGVWVPARPTTGDWYVTEGLAKALAVNTATGAPTLCCFSANNMSSAIQEHCAGVSGGILAGDNDAAGRAAVAEAMRRYADLRSVFPPDAGKDWNDVLVKQGIDALKTALSNPVGFDWPTPSPLPGDLPPVEPFNLALLPDAFQPWIADISERMQCPPDFPAIGAMTAIAAVVGRKIGIRPKRQDDWIVIGNLWGLIVGRPGVLKSPALQEAKKPLARLEAEAGAAYNLLKIQAEAEQEVLEQKRQVNKAKIRELLKQGGADSAELAALVIGSEDNGPVRPRYVVNDSSVEKLGETLNQNPNGVLVFRDELLGFLYNLERAGQEGAKQFYLEAWNGNGRFVYDRIGRGTVEIDACCLSILGSIQPEPLQTYLLTAPDDGLMQRFQLAVWPDSTRDWRNVDRWPDKVAKDAVWDVFKRLDDLVPFAIGATPVDEGDVPCLRFSEEAQLEFDQWRESLEKRLRTGDLSPAIETVLAKYRSLVPSLALLIHCVDVPEGGPVGLTALIKACAWTEYLESHAHRIYSAKLAPAILSARALAAKIKAGKLADRFTVRTVYQNGWSRLSTTELAQQGINLLVELDWLRAINDPTATVGGRPKTVYQINPAIWEAAP